MTGQTGHRPDQLPDDGPNGERHGSGHGGVPAPRRTPRPPLIFSPARLRAWRHARTLDHAALADAAGMAVADVAACEAGQSDPTPGMVAAWSAALGCWPDQLRSATPDAPAEYWRAANQAMPPMSPEDLAVVARVFARTAARRAAGHAAAPAGTNRPGDG